jgi:dTDP-4-amino-4,6-dideoxygalactose transaminase
MACSGTGALHALAAGLSLKAEKTLRWVTQAFTFPSAIQGPLVESLVCDIDPVHKGPSFKYLDDNKHTFDGVLVTNVFGLQCSIVEYEKWCLREEKYLIFDNAATPLGFLADGRSIHDVGDGAIISLHETKPFGRGEGGAVVCRRDVYSFVHQAMNFGFNIPAQIRIPNRYSSNWRMSDIAAAAICDHFDNIASWEEKFCKLIEFAVEKLAEVGLELAIPIRYPTVLACLLVRLRAGSDGEAVCRELNAHGVEAKHYYVPLLTSKSDAPEAWSLYDSTVCLPFHLDVSKEDLVRVFKLL